MLSRLALHEHAKGETEMGYALCTVCVKALESEYVSLIGRRGQIDMDMVPAWSSGKAYKLMALQTYPPHTNAWSRQMIAN